MTTIDSEFRSWMNDRKLRAEIVGNALDVSAQTIRNWRSSKIPKRKHDAVRRIMREWEQNPSTHIGPRLIVNASEKQFADWNLAAIHCQNGPKTIEQWAKDGLDEMAKEHFANPQLSLPLRPLPPPIDRVAEDTPPYRTKNDAGQA